MTHKLIYEGFDSPELINEINNSSSKKFLAELEFAYGLKVISCSINPSETIRRFLVACPQGLAVAEVWTHPKAGGLLYNYRSPHYLKSRGVDQADKESIYSRKLSTLMRTLKQNNVVPPSSGRVFGDAHRCFLHAIKTLRSHYGSAYKENTLDNEQLHELLKKVILGVSPSQNTLDISKDLLDKFNIKDKIRESRDENLKRFFEEEFMAVGADGAGNLIIGSAKLLSEEKELFKVIKPFKRFTDIPEEYEYLRAPLLMNKVAVENRRRNVTYYANLIPVYAGYDESLDIVSTFLATPDQYRAIWIFVPCSTLVH